MLSARHIGCMVQTGKITTCIIRHLHVVLLLQSWSFDQVGYIVPFRRICGIHDLDVDVNDCSQSEAGNYGNSHITCITAWPGRWRQWSRGVCLCLNALFLMGMEHVQARTWCTVLFYHTRFLLWPQLWF